ncbi:MAG: M24 family metallopeptidase [Trueperaceae bacterium]
MLETLREHIAKADAHALLVTQPANVRYLSKFTTPEDAYVLVTLDKVLFITDGRYTVQAAQEVTLETHITQPGSPVQTQVAELAKPYKLAVEADAITLAFATHLQETLKREVIPTSNLIKNMRLIKSAQEIEFIRESAALTDKAFNYILNVLDTGMTEIEVALELERFLRKQGSEGVAFDIAVASGERSAMPHGVASQKTIGMGELVALDFGAVLHGYHSDMTRTVGMGEVPDDQQALYAAVLETQELALSQIAPKKSGKAIDQLTRDHFKKRGLEQYVVHSLGHGVGLEIHEGPTLSQRQEDFLDVGMVVTVEPGLYVPGKAGVRIEDLVVVTENGCERLSHSPKTYLSIT